MIDDLDRNLFDKIIFLKSQFKISLTDFFLLASALLYNATVVTADHHEFEAVEKSGLVKFLWIR